MIYLQIFFLYCEEHAKMKKAKILLSMLMVPGMVKSVPIAGVDFSDESGASTIIPEDLDPGDSVTVSAGWTFPGTTGQILQGDANANAGRASAPVVKFDGPVTDGTVPLVGDPAPTDGIHQFSIQVGADPLKLTKVSFDFGKATGSANIRWMAFKTSLDDRLIYSEVGLARPAFTSVELNLSGTQYENLQNQTVDFVWYCGGQGSGDMDIDSIVIEGVVTTDVDGDNLPDAFERLIVDADPNDAILAIEDVLPADDFDGDGSSNLQEYNRETDPVDPDTDGDGLLDGVESGDGTFDNFGTDTGTDPLDPDTDDDGLLDGVETNDGSFDDLATDTGTSPLLNDTDGDLIPDGYEANNGLNPTVNDASADLDSDGASNFAEFTNGTQPGDPDTDDDGLEDGVESNSNVFASSSDTGTDPLNPDTDGDGLLDGVESNDGSFNGVMETGTNPLLVDSDGDQFRDGSEIFMHGTDPTNPGSFPATQTTVLFLEANGSGTVGADEVAVALLQDKFGLDKVTVQSASATATGDELAFDLLVISSTPDSGAIRGKFINSSVPIVNWEEAVSDNAVGEFGASSAVLAKSSTTIEMLLGDHPIAAGLPETITLFEDVIGQTNSSAMVFGDLAVVGTAVQGIGNGGSNIGGSVTGNALIIAIEAGDAVDPATGTVGGVAPARRVMMPWTDGALANLSADGLTLFSNALDWAIGNLGSPVPLQVTSLTIDDSVPGNRIATLVFQAKAGREYTVLTSTDLVDFASGNATAITTLTGAEGTMTFALNFNFLALPVSDAKRFFAIREGGGE